MLNINDLTFSHGDVATLRGLTMHASPAAITCVMGNNGAGKTTLIYNIMGVLQPARGTIMLDGVNMTHWPAHKRARAGVALVPQGRRIFPKLTVRENLEVGLQAAPRGVRTIPEDIFELFPILATMANRRGGDLSGGQQQQLAIARALVARPKVLLLDEPTEGIQPNVIQQIGLVLKKLVAERDMTIILVEQYLDFIREFGQYFYLMRRGRVVAEGSTRELDAQMVQQHLTASNPNPQPGRMATQSDHISGNGHVIPTGK